MTVLTSYNQFSGTHWETGSVHNFLAARGIVAPHTNQPYSEALLLGVSGGITFGYFTFAYQGYDPQCNILTRNTFDPLDTMLSRLGVVQNRLQTSQSDRAAAILADTLADGLPAIVWPDMWSMPYNLLPWDKGMWGAFPLVVYGHEPDKNVVHIADRAQVPLTVTIDQLAAARGRIKKDKFRLLTLEAPNPEKLATAVRLGIYDTIKLMTEKPPKGSVNNFGLTGLQFWAKMLRQPKQRLSWEKQYPAGRPMFAGLTSAYNFAFLFGKGLAQDAERGMYADFLAETAVLLQNPALHEAASRYRAAATAWQQLPICLLPDEITPFGETRRLMWRKHQLFLQQGMDALVEIGEINGRLNTLREETTADFPLTQPEVEAHREQIAAQVEAILACEREAVGVLQAAVG